MKANIRSAPNIVIFLCVFLILGAALAYPGGIPAPLSGKDIFAKKCASCHGKLGEGAPKMAKMLKTTIPDFGIILLNADTLTVWKKIILDGKKKMPAFKMKLMAAEIDSVIVYAATLAKSEQSGKPADTASVKEETKK